MKLKTLVALFAYDALAGYILWTVGSKLDSNPLASLGELILVSAIALFASMLVLAYFGKIELEVES